MASLGPVSAHALGPVGVAVQPRSCSRSMPQLRLGSCAEQGFCGCPSPSRRPPQPGSFGMSELFSKRLVHVRP